MIYKMPVLETPDIKGRTSIRLPMQEARKTTKRAMPLMDYREGF